MRTHPLRTYQHPSTVHPLETSQPLSTHTCSATDACAAASCSRRAAASSSAARRRASTSSLMPPGAAAAGGLLLSPAELCAINDASFCRGVAVVRCRVPEHKGARICCILTKLCMLVACENALFYTMCRVEYLMRAFVRFANPKHTVLSMQLLWEFSSLLALESCTYCNCVNNCVNNLDTMV